MDYANLLNRDYKYVNRDHSRAQRRRARLHSILIFASGFVAMAGLFSSIQDADASRSSQGAEFQELLTLPINVPTNSPAFIPQVSVQQDENWISETIGRGDTLSTLFSRMGISQKQMYEVLNVCESLHSLTDLKPGQTLHAQLDDGRLVKLRFTLNATSTIYIERTDNELVARLVDRPVELRNQHVSGTINSSLYVDGKQAGLSDSLILQLAEIFGWDIDFALDIRKGDSFTVIYQDEYLDGEKLRTGNILAAEFTNQGRTYRAVRYTGPDNIAHYFTPDGDSMRKAFIRSPVDFRRISSKFSRERFHPVLGVKRPHRGVDYAAATGTPIKAAGDGKVIFRGKKGGYGNTVIIQHGGQITTLYGHISKFVRTVRKGTQVKQGQLIGYVGMTGTATGPHLHYEFRVNGAHRNPLTVALPDAKPIEADLRADFEVQTQGLVAQLGVLTRLRLAQRYSHHA